MKTILSVLLFTVFAHAQAEKETTGLVCNQSGALKLSIDWGSHRFADTFAIHFAERELIEELLDAPEREEELYGVSLTSSMMIGTCKPGEGKVLGRCTITKDQKNWNFIEYTFTVSKSLGGGFSERITIQREIDPEELNLEVIKEAHLDGNNKIERARLKLSAVVRTHNGTRVINTDRLLGRIVEENQLNLWDSCALVSSRLMAR